MTDQSYYWSPEWQADEAESVREIEAGRGLTFTSADAAIQWLQED